MKQSAKQPNPIVERSFAFALEIVRYTQELESRNKLVIARQLIRSGTSIGANVREAQSAQSQKDFLHKMKLAAKEAEETEYWLLICQHSENYPECAKLVDEIGHIIRILTKITYTTRRNLP